MSKNKKASDWNELCDYVKKEILEYDDNMLFPRQLALKLQGLKKGQHIANNNSKINAKYDDKTILIAFKMCKNKIIDYLHNNETKIKDENHKINIVMRIVEPEINDVYLRLKEIDKVSKRVESKEFNNQYSKGANYIKKTKDVSDKMKKLF